MGLDDKHLDILQTVEASIVHVYHTNHGMRDNDALDALNALIDYYKQIARGESANAPALGGLSGEVADSIKSICDLRLKTREDAIAIVACLRKILKSAQRWNQKNGKRGYLEFVENYV